jgi:Mg-chelatase subunit ChlD/translation initiation factor 2 beta subunit (eIF-2beta)/eIF-5
MAALVNALDNYTPTQFGENGHAEYRWSNSIQEKILQLSFQVTRTKEDGVIRLAQTLSDILRQLKHQVKNCTLPEREVAKGYLSVLYRMIGHTRDIIDGKGEYTLGYMMVRTWYEFFPELALFALKCFVDLGDKTIHQYGSWKDLKYFCEYCKSKGDTVNSELIQYSIFLINEQIKRDYATFLSNSNDVSLAAKWAPREKSSFGWLYEALAKNYFKEFLETAKNEVQVRKAVLKCKTEYRKILSTLNRHIETLQVKQCEQTWSLIDFNKVTSISLSKQKKAFLNIKKNGQVRCPDNNDRITCAEHFNSHIQRAVKGEVEMKGKRVGMADFTKQAFELIRTRNQAEKDLLNSQWRDNASQTGALGKMIAMVDVSGSMNGDPMNVAIALGIRIAEKSIIGNRVMTFSAKPTWVNLDGCRDFISKVEVVQHAEWGMNTNFHAALDMILDAIIQNKMAPQDVQDMVLVILSDMQIDQGDKCDKNALYKTMENKYAEAGIRVHGAPYKPPHILFWNLRSTSGFPSLANQKNASMMSGFSPALLNLFCDQGMEALQSCTPWSLLNKSLENERYKIMDSKLQEILS